MCIVRVTLNTGHFAETLGAENAALVPESVIRDAESNIERYLTNHSEEFYQALNTAISKAVEDNHAHLVESGAVKADDAFDEDEEEDAPAACEGCRRDIEPNEAHNETSTGTRCESCQQTSSDEAESD